MAHNAMREIQMEKDQLVGDAHHAHSMSQHLESNKEELQRMNQRLESDKMVL